ncbi:MAG: MaoC/PaaZ C-terminal domain-containing protein [Bacillota bacterium]
MKIGTDIVGAKLKEYRTTVTWRQTTNYAASLGDMNPCYVDDRREGGIMAPPMFAVAVTWPLVENIHQYMDMPYPPELFRTMVHYTEHIEFFRPVRPGDELSVRGEVAAVVPHRSGTLVVFKFPVTDRDGRPFFTEYMGGLLRGVECAGAGRGTENIPAVPRLEDDPPPAWEAAIPISREAPYIYDGCTNIVFAIHTSPLFAHAVGLPGIILQGTATLAHSAAQLINREAGGNPERLAAISGRFTGMVFPDSSIRVQLLKREVENDNAHLFFRVLNRQGQAAVSGGYARFRL